MTSYPNSLTLSLSARDGVPTSVAVWQLYLEGFTRPEVATPLRTAITGSRKALSFLDWFVRIHRSLVSHFSEASHSKKTTVKILLTEYQKVITYAIDLIEPCVLSGSKKFDILTKVWVDTLRLSSSTWFSARLLKNALAEAYGMVLGAKNLAETVQKPYRRPTHSGKKMVLSETCAQVITDPKVKSFDLLVRLAYIGNKLSITLPLHRHSQFNRWYSEGVLSKTVTLFANRVQFSFEIDTGPKKVEGEILGVDIGMNKLLATTQRESYGEDVVRQKLEALHRKQFRSNAYYAAREDLKSYINHEVKQLPWAEMSTVVVENLKGLKHGKKGQTRRRGRSKSFRRLIHNWNYRQVLERVQALAEENRVSFRSVSPYKTSQLCPVCGHVDQKNRLSQELFKCQSCGHSDNADFVGALNILNRFFTGAYGPGCKLESGTKVPAF